MSGKHHTCSAAEQLASWPGHTYCFRSPPPPAPRLVCRSLSPTLHVVANALPSIKYTGQALTEVQAKASLYDSPLTLLQLTGPWRWSLPLLLLRWPNAPPTHPDNAPQPLTPTSVI